MLLGVTVAAGLNVHCSVYLEVDNWMRYSVWPMHPWCMLTTRILHEPTRKKKSSWTPLHPFTTQELTHIAQNSHSCKHQTLADPPYYQDQHFLKEGKTKHSVSSSAYTIATPCLGDPQNRATTINGRICYIRIWISTSTCPWLPPAKSPWTTIEESSGSHSPLGFCHICAQSYKEIKIQKNEQWYPIEIYAKILN